MNILNRILLSIYIRYKEHKKNQTPVFKSKLMLSAIIFGYFLAIYYVSVRFAFIPRYQIPESKLLFFCLMVPIYLYCHYVLYNEEEIQSALEKIDSKGRETNLNITMVVIGIVILLTFLLPVFFGGLSGI